MLRYEQALKEGVDEVAKTGSGADAQRADGAYVLPRAGFVPAIFFHMEETAAGKRGGQVPGSTSTRAHSEYGRRCGR